ncbi:unnamed protein product, partial [Polarella glacialis]
DSLDGSRAALDEVRSELRAFMDEQRIFCGFLDTEQRSYQELMRQEVNALSRLLDSTLRTDGSLRLVGLSGFAGRAASLALSRTPSPQAFRAVPPMPSPLGS